MEAQKPNTKATKPAAKAKSNAPGIKNASWVIVCCFIVAVCLFIFWFGNPMHFDEEQHPVDIWGTIYKGGFIVPVLQTLFLTVIVLAVERGIALSAAKGKGNIAKFVAGVKACLAKNDIDGAEKYLDLFCAKSKTAKQYVQKWMPIVAASQSVKGNEKEREFLRSWVNVVDYQ